MFAYLGSLAALTLASLAVLAATSKLRAPRAFQDIVASWQVLPDALVRPVAVAVPVAEMAAGILVLVGLTRSGTAIFAFLLASTTFAAVVVLRHGRDVACGCFSVSASSRLGNTSLARNVLLLAGAAVVLASNPAISWSLPASITAAFLVLSVEALLRLLELNHGLAR